MWRPVLLLSCALLGCDPSAEVEQLVATVRTDDQTAPIFGTSEPGAPEDGVSEPPRVSGPTTLLAGGLGRFELVGDGPIDAVVLSVDGEDGFFTLPLPGEPTARVVVGLAQGAAPGAYVLALQSVRGDTPSRPARSALTVLPAGSAGELQIELTWATPADLDLHVVEPLGLRLDPTGAPVREEIFFANPAALSGGELLFDANASCLPDEPSVERVTWLTPLEGVYDVYVDPWASCGATTATPFTVVARVRGEEVARVEGLAPAAAETRGSACLGRDTGEAAVAPCLDVLDVTYALPD